MKAAELFLVQHARFHAIGTGASYSERVFGGLSDHDMRVRPAPHLNSLIWLLWHMARTEDVAVNLVVADCAQVLDDQWTERMNIPWRTIGTGMTEDDVESLTRQADMAAVKAYHAAVGQRTQDVVGALESGAWDEILGIADTARAAAAGAFAPQAPWIAGVGYRAWQGHSRAVQLASSGIAHNAMHLGEAVTIRSLAGFPLGI